MWKEIIKHRRYIEAGLKWCTGNDRKACFLIIEKATLTFQDLMSFLVILILITKDVVSLVRLKNGFDVN